MADNNSAINPRVIETQNGQALVPDQSAGPDMMILDRDWVKIAFLTPSNTYTGNYDSVTRFFSSASMKFTSAVIGKSIEINPKPQFTRYADIRSKGIFPDRHDVTVPSATGNYGMGRYYSEAFDDNAQRIYMRFGVPQFNSLVSFLLNAADYQETQLARTGRISKLYTATKVVFSIATFIAFPVLTAGIYLYKGLNALLGSPTSKFYTIKPTMHTYWSAVNTLVNNIGVSKGLFPTQFLNNVDGQVNQPGSLFNINAGVTDGSGNVLPNSLLGQLSRLMPDVIDSHGYFDVFAIAAKPQALANRLFDFVYNQVNTTADISGPITITDAQRNNPDNPELTNRSIYNSRLVATNTSFLDFVKRSVITFSDYFVDNSSNGSSVGESDPRAASSSEINQDNQQVENGATLAEGGQNNAPTKESFLNFLSAEFSEGAAFAIFQVDYTGSITDSFSNSAVESELSNSINSTSSSMREARFNVADFNIANIAGGLVSGLANSVKDVAMGALDGVTMGYGSSVMSALGILAGNGYIDIPKHWQSSSASIGRSTYSMELISPYGNVVSQMTNIYIPLSMILVGALPLATGKQSYTSPFLVQLFDRGRSQIQLGLIESVSITRGTSNLGFTNVGYPMAMKVSFSVADLSSIISMPLATGGLFNLNNSSSDMMINDYIAVLAGQDIYSQIYALPRIKINIAKAINSAKRFVSPAYWASAAHNSVTAGFLSFGPVGWIARGVEGASRGSSLLNPMSGSN